MQTNYTQPGDIVTYGGYSYVALTINIGANPSAFGFEQDGDGANWEILTDGYKFKGEWDITLTYRLECCTQRRLFVRSIR